MQPRRCETIFIRKLKATCLVVIALVLSPASLTAEPNAGSVVCREELSPALRERLVAKLRDISGLDLRFDRAGILKASGKQVSKGSASARALLLEAISGRNAIVIEDASNSSDVAFCRVLSGQWKTNRSTSPVFVVQMDFSDFDQVIGDTRARAAFNEGWGLLHEFDHIVNESADGGALNETGECEASINSMRREINLPERVDYFYTLSPIASKNTFITRFVRLAFEETQLTKKKKRYWITWDVSLVGGVNPDQLAALR